MSQALPFSFLSACSQPFTGLPSGKTARGQITAANDAGEAQPGVTVEIVVP